MLPNKLQIILDHFGVGNFQLTKSSEILKISNLEIMIIYLETSTGKYLLIQLPKNIMNRSEIQAKIDKELDLSTHILTYPKNEKVQFAHVDGYFYSLRKV